MELKQLVHQAQARDVSAFTELTRRYQKLAFGSAVAMLRDLDLAEDAVQEAFLAAYLDLGQLREAEAFPGWLRGIVRHQCHRILRRRRLELLPLEDAAGVPSEVGRPEEDVARRELRRAVRAAVEALPDPLREVITLFYLQEQSQQQVAAFLGVPASTVNNRLHAARRKLKGRLEVMAGERDGRSTRRDLLRAAGAVTVGALLKDAVGEAALPEEFAERIGEILRVQGPVIEARFDPETLPEILSALTIRDGTGGAEVTIEVAQRLENDLVRCVAAEPLPALRRGARIAATDAPARAPIADAVVERAVEILAPPAGPAELLETGIKVIDLLSPVARGGSVGIFGDMGVGKMVLIEELVRGLASRHGGVSLFTFVQAAEAPMIRSGMREMPGLARDAAGAVQTFYILSERPTGPAAALAGLDAILYLSRDVGAAGIWPAVDPLLSRSRLLDPAIVGPEHFETAARVRSALERARPLEAGDPAALSEEERPLLARARKLRRFFSQPFFVAEPFTRLPGRSVARAETVRACRAILDGKYDALPEDAFRFTGGTEDVVENAART